VAQGLDATGGIASPTAVGAGPADPDREGRREAVLVRSPHAANPEAEGAQILLPSGSR